MSRSERRAERIRSEVPIEKVLILYGYDIQDAGGAREQQFRCDLHGDGNDGKPSARCYPSTNQWYCWACNQSRDAIQTVREKEGLSFFASLDRLEQHFRLPPMAWEEGDRAPGNVDLFAGAFDPLPITFENERDRLNRLLRSIYKEKTFPLSVALSLTEDFDRLCFLASADPEGLIEDMVHLRRVVIDKMRTRCTAS